MINSRFKQFFIASVLTLSIFSCDKTIADPRTDPRFFTHLDLGNPTGATADSMKTTNFLLKKLTYAVSYNNELKHANWVSWELNSTYLGSADRSDDFEPDKSLPKSFSIVSPSDYTNSGFDRGHVIPSADRTFSSVENQATFLMTNMLPQAPELNRKCWGNLEQFSRDLVRSGYTLFIVAGAYGTGGDGSKGMRIVLESGVHVPERNYKVIVATKKTSVSQLSEEAIIIATDFPNSNVTATKRDWVRFITTAEDIEKDANIKLFDALPKALQDDYKKRLFNPDDSPVTVNSNCKKLNGRELYVGRDGGCYYFTSGNKKTYVDRNLCDCTN